MIRALALFSTLALWLGGSAAHADILRLAATTSFENSGLADVLLPAIAAETGIDVQLIVVGTGQALRLGAAGDVDAVLVHDRAAEEAFVAAGHATHRRPIMYNDFVLVGPAKDPANVATASTATEALTRIAIQQSRFVSRGDDSGTHRAERALWDAAGHDPAHFGFWYAETGSGMGAALNTAAGMEAYLLSDRASWLAFGNKAGLVLLFSGDPALFNQYSFLPVSPTRHPYVRHDLAAELEAWLTTDRARDLIDGFRIADTQLFVFNATKD